MPCSAERYSSKFGPPAEKQDHVGDPCFETVVHSIHLKFMTLNCLFEEH